MNKKYKKNKEVFNSNLCGMINKFIDENKVVSKGDRVQGGEYHKGEHEITSIEFDMTATGSFYPYLPMLRYHGKPVSNKGVIMASRKPVLLRVFTTKSGLEYEIEHICFSLSCAKDMRH